MFRGTVIEKKNKAYVSTRLTFRMSFAGFHTIKHNYEYYALRTFRNFVLLAATTRPDLPWSPSIV